VSILTDENRRLLLIAGVVAATDVALAVFSDPLERPPLENARRTDALVLFIFRVQKRELTKEKMMIVAVQYSTVQYQCEEQSAVSARENIQYCILLKENRTANVMFRISCCYATTTYRTNIRSSST